MKLSEVLPKLTEKFPAEAHKERDLPGGGTWWYLPWQTIRSRLNEVCPDEWEMSYDEPKYLDKFCYVTCTLTICGVTRRAIGSAPIELISKTGKDMSRGNPIERAVADAFKNACEAYGIAAYLDEQADDRTKRDFSNYMAKRGNAKPAEEYKRQNGVSAPRKTESNYKPFGQPATPRPAATPKPAVTPPQPQTISEDQRTRLWTIARLNRFTDAGVKALIEAYSFASTKDITVHAYDGIVEKLQDPDYVAMYNEKGEIALMNAALANGAASP